LATRLSNIITGLKERAFKSYILRSLCYAGIALALLLWWLYAPETEIAFVYNNF
jgi:hypothetical protein